MHVSILEQVHELGHYPERIVDVYANATSTQKFEEALLKQLMRHWTDLPSTYKAYIQGLQTDKEEQRQHGQDVQKRKDAEEVMEQIRALGREPLRGHLYTEKQNENHAYRKVIQEEKMRNSLQAS